MSLNEPTGNLDVPADTAILLVEDDCGLREATQDLIEMFGHTVVATGTAQEARELLARHPFRILVSDVRLGDGNGVALAHEARALLPGIGLLLLSGKDLPEEGVELPAHAEFLRKPYEFEEFGDVLAALS